MISGLVAQSNRAPTGQSEVAGANPAEPTLDLMRIVVANMADTDKVYRKGAKMYVECLDGDGEHPVVRGLSRGGRTVTKRINIKRLENARVKTVPAYIFRGYSFGCAPSYHGRPMQFVVDMINNTMGQ